MFVARCSIARTLRNVHAGAGDLSPSRFYSIAAVPLRAVSGRKYEAGDPFGIYEYGNLANPPDDVETHLARGWSLRPVTDVRGLNHGNESFIYKTTSSEDKRTLHRRQLEELAGSRRLYLPVDSLHNGDHGEDGLIYPRLNMTLDALIDMNPDLSMTERIKIMRSLAEALHELHSKGWLHNQLSPHHVHLNVRRDASGNLVVSDVKLGGFEPAFLLDDDDGPSGHVDYAGWRSPETQVQPGNSAASEMFSLGLMFLHVLGRSTLWHADALSLEYDPPTDTVVRQFVLFGPVPEELLACISGEFGDWPTWYRNMATSAEEFVEEFPQERFAAVAKRYGIPADAVDLLERMVELAPSRRWATDAILGHAVWRGSWKLLEDE